jgi:RNA polymerase sigma-70 factor, ECF subfamily
MNTQPHEKAVTAHVSTLFSRALSLTRDLDDAWDLVQDTMERALTHIPACLPPEKMGSWLLTILRNLFIDSVRSVRFRAARLRDEGLAELPHPEAEEPAVWQRFELPDVRTCLARLPAGLARAYALYAFDGLSYEQIAKQLNISKATVGTRLFRARLRLRELLLAGRHAEAARTMHTPAASMTLLGMSPRRQARRAPGRRPIVPPAPFLPPAAAQAAPPPG